MQEIKEENKEEVKQEVKEEPEADKFLIGPEVCSWADDEK